MVSLSNHERASIRLTNMAHYSLDDHLAGVVSEPGNRRHTKSAPITPLAASACPQNLMMLRATSPFFMAVKASLMRSRG
jgi:hypothetical protein